MKRALSILLVGLLLAAVMQPAASAASILYAKYAVSLRSTPSSSGSVYKTIPKGGQVTRLSGSSGGYIRVSYKGCSGWAPSSAFSSSSGSSDSGGSSGSGGGGGGRPGGGFPGGFKPSMTLSSKKLTFTMGGDPVTLTASVKMPTLPGADEGDGETETYTYTWTSLDPTVATVSTDGTVTPVGTGTCKIKCICVTDSGKITAKCTVKVKPIVPTSVTLDSSSITLAVGETHQLTATVAPEDATNKSVSWSSKKKKIAKVSQTGLVTAVKVGTTKIVCKTKSGSLKAVCTVTVVADA